MDPSDGEQLRRSLTRDELETFEQDGVVCLRAILPLGWLERMYDPVERVLDGASRVDMTEMALSIEASGGRVLSDPNVAADSKRGRFFSGVDHWRVDSSFRSFAIDSPLPEIAAQLMRSSVVNLYEDSLLVKEPGTVEPTAYHQDLSYFHVEGEQICTIWCPLDAVTPQTGGVRFVRGSHSWPELYRPNLFVSDQPIPGTRGEDLSEGGFDPEDLEVLSFEMQPGDVTVHHARMLHGASGNASARQRRRAISVRYCGDDARTFVRSGAPKKPYQANLENGRRLDSSDCPVVWPRQTPRP